MQTKLYIVLSVVLLFFACQKLERNNPFDPECPKDIWTPTNFTSTQVGSSIKLSWSQPINNITGFAITKKVDNGTATNLETQAKGTTQYTDANPIGGKMHIYSITAKAGNYESNTVLSQIIPVFAPVLSNPLITTVTSTAIIVSSNISSDGGATVTARGICWGTSQNPTVLNSKTSDGTGSGNFTSTITGLNPGILYYIRAYASNSAGTNYSTQLTTTTTSIPPTLVTSSLTNVLSTTVTGGGTVITDGGSPVTARGVCWSTVSNPTTALSTKTNDGTGVGTFVSSISGLLPGTRYYFRAYATNSIGTAYGSEVTATTLAALPTLSTSIISAIATTTATGGGAIISDGGSPVTARGVCWSTAQSPTISNSKTTDGTGSGSFTSLVAGLTPATTYYVRAYATNTIGTAYGNQVSFSTYSVPTLATITTSTPTKITSTEATIGGNLLSEGNASVTEKGVCISLTANPTTASWKYPNGTVTGTGVFSSNFTGFTPNTTYYVRAYAINIVGTAYGNEVSFKTLQPTGITVSDIEGNMYRTVTIGTQVWMVDNLKTTHYNNGTVIPNITADATWIALTSAAYCWYNNDLSNKTTYGALYNWYAVTTGRL
jgi:hypothetical protein